MARKSNTAKEKKETKNANLEANLEANLSADHSAEVKDEALKNADETDRTLEEGATAEAGDEALKNTAETNCTLEDDKVVEGGQVINPIAYAIKLRAIHPHDSYGRCGYRFYKDKETTIPASDLTGEQVLTLAEDPWLELIPVCEE
ncbi:hypothetical protein U0W77_11175 [Avibacterium paragallinarum]|uniref:hypothetical protein n=1 Tax=Avibacterium paragallinarum TaxID=728 RepID=UPI0039C60104